MKVIVGILAAATIAVVATPGEVMAQSDGAAEHRSSNYYRKPSGPKVRSYVVRRGGYSYSVEDVYNTYGDARTRYGSNNFYRDPLLDRQTSFGPFDNGFFFDSGVGPRGGNAPQY